MLIIKNKISLFYCAKYIMADILYFLSFVMLLIFQLFFFLL
jgi:hypothetical protein